MGCNTMGYKNFEALEGSSGEHQEHSALTFSADALSVALPDVAFIRDAEFTRDGMDLILKSEDGQAVIEGYFAAEPAPYLVGPDGSSLSPNLVNSFLKSGSEFAANATASDESPVGAVLEMKGDATVTRLDGTSEKIQIGTPIFQGDVIETSADAAVNVKFVDETSFAVSEDSRLAIDEYVFDPATAEGSTNFSVLKGMFVFTSGLIGREDPDDVHIETPSGSIGIRGTIIAGDVNSGEITVVEGAIVLTDQAGNDVTLDNQFETARFNAQGGSIDNIGQLAAQDVIGKFSSISSVSPQLFSSISDAANEGVTEGTVETTTDDANAEGTEEGESNEATPEASEDGTTGEQAPAETKAAPEGTTEPAQEPQPLQNNGAADPVPAPPPMQGPIITFAGNNFGGAGSGFGGALNDAGIPAGPAIQGGPPAGGFGLAGGFGAGPLNVAPPPPPQPAGTFNSTTQPFVNTADTNSGSVFATSVQLIPILENTIQQAIARVSGINSIALQSVAINGPGAINFEAVRIDANTFEIRTVGDFKFDFERHSIGNFITNFTAVAGDGRTYSGGFNPSVTNIDEAPRYLGNDPDDAGPLASQISETNFFGVSVPAVNTTWTYDFSKAFFDQDLGSNLTYSVSGITSGATGLGVNISTDFENTGILTINLNDSLPVGAQDFYFTITASDNYNPALSIVIRYDLYDVAGTAPIITGTDGVTAASNSNAYVTASTFTVSHSYNKLLFDDVNNTVTVDGSRNNNTINTAGGVDLITIEANAANNNITAGSGDDEIDLKDLRNIVNGDSGNDTFELDSSETNFFTQLYDAYTTPKINGGTDELNLSAQTGGDTVSFGTSNTAHVDSDEFDIANNDYYDPTFGLMINFGLIDDDFIKNIELLSFENSQTNRIILNYSDVMAMTDQRHTLVIEGDDSDTMEFNSANSNGPFQQTGSFVDSTDTDETFNVYSNGTVTLVIDSDIAVTGAISQA